MLGIKEKVMLLVELSGFSSELVPALVLILSIEGLLVAICTAGQSWPLCNWDLVLE